MSDATRKLINEIYQRTHGHCYDGAAAGNFLREVTQALAARATPAQPAPSPSSVGAAIRALPLPEPFMTMRFNAKAGRWDEVRGEACTSDTRVYSQGQVNEIRAEAAALAEQQRPFCPTQQQFQEWCERHDMRADRGDVREAFDDAASLYLTAQDGQKSEG